MAARENQIEILKLFIGLEGIDFEIRNGVTHTPLMGAANAGKVNAVRFLLENFDVKLNAFDENDFTSLHLAAVKI